MLQYNSSTDQFTEVIFDEFSSSDEEEQNLNGSGTNRGSILILRNGSRKLR